MCLAFEECREAVEPCHHQLLVPSALPCFVLWLDRKIPGDMVRKTILKLHARRAAAGLLLAALLVAGVVTGAAFALRLDGPRTYSTSLATVSVEVRPSLDGRVELYVPLVDWRVVTDPYRAPLAIVMETRAVDRQAAQRALAPAGARRELAQLRTESREMLSDALHRAAVVTLLGGTIGGIIAGAMIGVALLKRRFVVWGVFVGAGVSLAFVMSTALAIGRLDERELRNPEFVGRASELPALLAFSQQLLYAGRDYERLYARALDSLDNLRAFTSTNDRVGDSTYLLASDIHNNEFVLDAFDRFAGDKTVFLAGDYGQIGARVEQRIVPKIAGLGGKVVAVSGNHDSASFMRDLERQGATVLRRRLATSAPWADSAPPEPATTGTLHVLGYDDPLMTHGDEPHVLRVHDAKYRAHVEALIEWYDALETRPDVLLIHQRGLARRLLEHLVTSDPKARRLVVLTGHDHRAAVEHLGAHLLVDGGTLGAGGPFAIGEQTASFAQLHFRGARLVSVDIVRIDPISGSASNKHVDT